jgi:hypothetical protein
VALIHSSGLSKKIVAQHEHTVPVNTDAPWQDALQVFGRLLSELSLPANTQLHISLASDLVRYLVLPATDQSIAQSDRHAFAQAAFRETFGAESLGWSIQCDDAAPNAPAVCAAVDQFLLDALQTLSTQKNLTLKSVQPYFVSAANALSGALKKADGIVVMVEHARLLMATFKQGVCIQLRSQALMQDWQEHLPELLSRTLLVEDEVARVVSIYAPTHKTNTLSPIKDWQIKRLGLAAKSNLLPSPYAMLEVMM